MLRRGNFSGALFIQPDMLTDVLNERNLNEEF